MCVCVGGFVQGPFEYEALAPADISFVPLNQTETMDGNQLMAFYEKVRLEHDDP